MTHSKTCPKCKQENNPAFKSCWQCGVDLTTGEPSVNKAFVKERRSAKKGGIPSIVLIASQFFCVVTLSWLSALENASGNWMLYLLPECLLLFLYFVIVVFALCIAFDANQQPRYSLSVKISIVVFAAMLFSPGGLRNNLLVNLMEPVLEKQREARYQAKYANYIAFQKTKHELEQKKTITVGR